MLIFNEHKHMYACVCVCMCKWPVLTKIPFSQARRCLAAPLLLRYMRAKQLIELCWPATTKICQFDDTTTNV